MDSTEGMEKLKRAVDFEISAVDIMAGLKYIAGLSCKGLISRTEQLILINHVRSGIGLPKLKPRQSCEFHDPLGEPCPLHD